MLINSIGVQTSVNTDNTPSIPNKNDDKEKNNSLFEDFFNWTQTHTANSNTLLDSYGKAMDIYNKAGEVSNSIAESNLSPEKKEKYALKLDEALDEADSMIDDAEKTYTNNRQQAGIDYSFMEGRNPQDEQAYSEQLNKFTAAEIALKDKNQDGILSKDEYINWQLENATDVKSKDELEVRTAAAFDKINKDYDCSLDRFLKATVDTINWTAYCFYQYTGKFEMLEWENPVRQLELNRFYADVDTIYSDDEGNTSESLKDGSINIDGLFNWAQSACNDKKWEIPESMEGLW